MAEDALVSIDLEGGAELVRALDEAGFPVVAAIWLFYPEIDTWKLVIATPKADDLQQTYIEIGQIADRAGITSPDIARIRLVLPSDPIVSTLSKAVRVEGLSGIRFSRNMINGIYVDDAYIYRAAA